MTKDDLLTGERRARMAAERLLAQKEAELNEANRMLSRHARSLSEDLVETREEVVEVREDLERKTVEVDIAKRRLWSSIETVEDGFAVFDAESRLVIANPAYYAPFDGATSSVCSSIRTPVSPALSSNSSANPPTPPLARLSSPTVPEPLSSPWPSIACPTIPTRSPSAPPSHPPATQKKPSIKPPRLTRARSNSSSATPPSNGRGCTTAGKQRKAVSSRRSPGASAPVSRVGL
mgnify:CR=1 FL=1